MGFAEELAQSKQHQGDNPPPEAPATPPAQAAAPVAPSEPQKGDISVMDMNFNLPAGNEPVKPEAAKPATPAADPVATKPKIRLSGQEFDTIDEALAYADRLALDKAKDEAVIAHMKQQEDAKTKANTPPPKAWEEEVEEKFFEDPKAAIMLIKEQAKKEVFEQYNEMTEKQKQDATKAEANKKIWEGFYETHPDLSDPATRDYVQNYLLQRHWTDLKDLPMKDSLPKLAEMARQALKIKKDDSLPAKTLQAGPAIVPGASAQSTTSQQPSTAPEKVDFVSQVNSYRRRNTK